MTGEGGPWIRTDQFSRLLDGQSRDASPISGQLGWTCLTSLVGSGLPDFRVRQPGAHEILSSQGSTTEQGPFTLGIPGAVLFLKKFKFQYYL
jgi:hypothetical protein